MNEWADGSRVRTTEITAAAAHSGAAGGGNVPGGLVTGGAAAALAIGLATSKAKP